MPYHGKSALLVEDDDAIRLFLSRYLKRMGMEVTEAEDGMAAIRKLDACNPDLIITDLSMPRMNGVEFIQEARKSGFKNPIIAVTGAAEDLEVMAITAGATMVLHKPIFRVGLLDAINSVMPGV